MEKQHYFFKLIPPRQTFPADITADEAALMVQHSVYWADNFAAGKLLAYGSVFVPGGAFGLGILEVEDEAAALATTTPPCSPASIALKFIPCG
jgi:hypothetical protein